MANISPLMGFVSFENRRKSQGAKFDQYGVVLCTDCSTIPSFYCLNCFMQTAYNFKVIFFIECATFWQELTMHHAIAIEEWAKPSNLKERGIFFSVLALLAPSTGMITIYLCFVYSYKPFVIFLYNWGVKQGPEDKTRLNRIKIRNSEPAKR